MDTITNPANPIEAVTHPDPYPYYARLVQERPFYRDDILGVWVASSAAAVKEILNHPLARVRPVTEPIPLPIAGTPQGEIFGRLVRMNDGAYHGTLKSIVSESLASVNPAHVVEKSRRFARLLLKEQVSQPTGGELTDFTLRLPISVMSSMLGVDDSELPEISQKLPELAQSFTAPASDVLKLEAGKIAANYLRNTFDAPFPDGQASMANPDTLFSRFVQRVITAGFKDRAVITANAIGFLFQAYEATAGLIGNSLVALASRPALREEVRRNPVLVTQLVQEVLRFDPPVQNTRRFLAGDATIGGQELKAGETVLVLLAAANRDSSLNPEPNRFDLSRENRQSFTFGDGPHTCPGQNLAALIAQAALEELIEAGLVPGALPRPVSYRPSVNTRVPVL